MAKFTDKVVIVTGAAGGIGKAFVKKAADEGAKIVLVDLNQSALDAIVVELGLTEDRTLTIAADVSKEEEVQNYVNKAVDKFGQIDGFFNNAGIEGPNLPIEEYPTEAFNKVLDINVKGVFYGLKYVVPEMKKRGKGSIVNTTSVAGLSGGGGMIGYIASKHAVIGITRSVAPEVAPFGIRVNAVAPGPINTRMMRQIEENIAPGTPEVVKSAQAESVPMKRYGEPEEVADVVAFLLSDESSYVAQSIYTVDGGVFGQ